MKGIKNCYKGGWNVCNLLLLCRSLLSKCVELDELGKILTLRQVIPALFEVGFRYKPSISP